MAEQGLQWVFELNLITPIILAEPRCALGGKQRPCPDLCYHTNVTAASRPDVLNSYRAVAVYRTFAKRLRTNTAWWNNVRWPGWTHKSDNTITSIAIPHTQIKSKRALLTWNTHISAVFVVSAARRSGVQTSCFLTLDAVAICWAESMPHTRQLLLLSVYQNEKQSIIDITCYAHKKDT